MTRRLLISFTILTLCISYFVVAETLSWNNQQYNSDNPPSIENLDKLKQLIIQNGISEEYFNQHFKLLYADKDIFNDGEWMGAYFLLENLDWVDDIYSPYGGYEFSKINENQSYSLVMYFEAKYPLDEFAPVYQNLREVNLALSKEETEAMAKNCVGNIKYSSVQFGPHGNVPTNGGIFGLTRDDRFVEPTSSDSIETLNVTATYLYYSAQGNSGKVAVINLETGNLDYCGSIQAQNLYAQMSAEGLARSGAMRQDWISISPYSVLLPLIIIVVIIVLIIIYFKSRKRND